MEQHGIQVTEVPTTIVVADTPDPTIPVVFGTAPVHLSTRSVLAVNEAVLVNSFQEAVDAFGYSDNWEDYSLCEFMDSFWKQYNQSAAVLVNVLDPTAHKSTVAPADVAVATSKVTLTDDGVLKAGVIVKNQTGSTTYVLNTDYTLSYNASGKLVVTAKSGGAIPSNVTTLKIGYDKFDLGAVGATEIIGGVDSSTGKETGLELLDQVFPRFGLVPSLVLAPGYSTDPLIASVMAAKASNINGHFKAEALIDLDVEDIDQYGDAPAWKSANNLTSEFQTAGYPKLSLGSKVYNFSSHLAGATCKLDASNGSIPYASPSNKQLKIDGTVQQGGRSLFLSPDQAAYLNAQGIVTAVNFVGGFRSWGNRTAAFPLETDPVKSFIPVRRMFNWISNQIILTYWKYVDDPLNTRLIEAVTDSINIWLNGLQASGALLGGRVEFIKSENSTADLMNGKIKFHLYLTPPSPAQEIDFLLEYDVQYLQTLFAA